MRKVHNQSTLLYVPFRTNTPLAQPVDIELFGLTLAFVILAT